MDAKIEKRRAFLINIAYFVLILGAVYVFFRFAFWPTSPFLFAFFFAVVMQKPVEFITSKTPLKRGIASLLLTLLSLLIVVGLLTLLGTKIYSEIRAFISYLMATFDNVPDFIATAREWTLNKVNALPRVVGRTAAPYIDRFFNTLTGSFTESESAIAQAQATGSTVSSTFSLTSLVKPLSGTVSGVISTASKLPSKIIAVVVCFIACCFITSDYKKITSFIKRQISPEKGQTLSKTKALTLRTMGKMLKAYCIIIAITFTEISIGLSILSIAKIYTGGYIILIAIGIAVVDILPILGSGTILVPWAIISLVTGKFPLFLGLIILYAVITVLRQFIEPRLVAGQLGLPPIVTLIGMYFGLKLFSVLGMFVVPLIINVLKVLNDEGVISIWKTKPGQSELSIAPILPTAQSLEHVKRKVKLRGKKK